MKRLSLALALVTPLLALSCRDAKRDSAGFAKRDLTPIEYQALTDSQRLQYKTGVIRVPALWGGVLVPLDSGGYASPIDKVIHKGDLNILAGLYNQAQFELRYPKFKLEYINFDMWSENFRSALAVALSSRKAPAYYIARDLPLTIEQGMYADLTDLMHKWDRFKEQPEGSIRQGTVNGRIYTLAANELGAEVIRYRKDWFREAGIFNEKGEPGPPANWTWDDFHAIAKKLTNASKARYGYVGPMGSFFFNEAHGLELFAPDPTGKHDWRFYEDSPLLLKSLQNARDMVSKEKCVFSSTSIGWTEWHNEFDGGRAAMVPSFAPHIPRESLANPYKMGADKLYADTVGMAPPPRGTNGFQPLRPITNPVGFDPTLSKEELEVAFEWCKSWFYGDAFVNRMRAAAADAKIKGQTSVLYSEILALPYKPQENLLDKPLEKVFPADYLATYKAIRESHAPPLPREFGIKEPPSAELTKATAALYSDAITTNTDLKVLIAKHANLINANLLNFGGKANRDKMRRFLEARTQFYRQYYPEYYQNEWRGLLQTAYRLP